MQIIRSFVRPLVTLVLVLVLALMVYQGKEVPELFFGLVSGVVGWWFYDRSRNKKPGAP